MKRPPSRRPLLLAGALAVASCSIHPASIAQYLPGSSSGASATAPATTAAGAAHGPGAYQAPPPVTAGHAHAAPPPVTGGHFAAPPPVGGDEPSAPPPANGFAMTSTTTTTTTVSHSSSSTSSPGPTPNNCAGDFSLGSLPLTCSRCNLGAACDNPDAPRNCVDGTYMRFGDGRCFCIARCSSYGVAEGQSCGEGFTCRHVQSVTSGNHMTACVADSWNVCLHGQVQAPAPRRRGLRDD